MAIRGIWGRLAELPLVVEDYRLEGLSRQVSSDFLRRTTVVRLRGEGLEGVGEDVTYDGADQERFQQAATALPLEAAFQ